MTIDEIFTKLITHMKEGVKTHCEFARAFDFLGLEGFARMHDHHQCEEKENYLKLFHYYSCHYHKLIKVEEITSTKIIPDIWYKYTTMNVDTGTKKSSTKEMMDKWIAWEVATKKLYQEMRQELTAIGELDAAIFLDTYICDVSKELSHAERKSIKLESLGYDMEQIILMSEALDKKYKKKLGW